MAKKFKVFGFIIKYTYYRKVFHKWLQENHPDSPEENNLIVPESKDVQLDEKGQPITYWGGKEKSSPNGVISNGLKFD